MSRVYAFEISQPLFEFQPGAESVSKDPTLLISQILPNIYVAAGVILLIYLVAGGFAVITASGSAEKAAGGQKAITNALLGFLIIFASYWIIQLIQVLTGIPILGGFGG